MLAGGSFSPLRLACFETLESRTLLAVTAVEVAGALSIDLSAASDSAMLSANGAADSIQVQGTSFTTATFSGVSSIAITYDAASQAVTFNGSTAMAITGALDVSDVSSATGEALTFAATTTYSFGSASIWTAETASVGTVAIDGNLTTTTDSVVIGTGTAATSATTDVGANVTSATEQTYGGPVVLTSNTLLTSNGTTITGAITFVSTLDGTSGAETLQVSTAGTAEFAGVVGGSLNAPPTLGGLVINGGPSLLEGGNISTQGAQDYGGAVTFTQDTTFLTNTGTQAAPAPGGSIFFASTLDGSGGPFSATLATYGAASVTFGGAVGGSASTPDIANLNDDAFTIINGGAVRTAGYQAYYNTANHTAYAVTLGTSTMLTSTGDTAQSLQSAIDLAVVDGAFSLTAEADSVDFFGTVGGNVPLASLTTEGNTSPAAGSAVWTAPGAGGLQVITTGSQTYNEPVSITGPSATAFTSTAGNITFNSTVTGALTTTSPDTTTFNRPVSTTQLTTNGVGGHGITEINTSTVTSRDSQTYNEPVLLTNNPSLSSTFDGNLTFNSTVGGNSALTASSPGAITFNGLVSIASLSTDTITHSGITNINTGTVNTVGPQTYGSPVLLANNPVLMSMQSSITFNSTVGGNSALTTNSSGTTTFNALVSIASLSVSNFNGQATTNINTGTVNTVGSQAYNAPLLLANNPALGSGQGSITFNSTVGGNSNLTVNDPGTTTFKVLVSIAGLSINSSQGTTAISGGTITTTGAQTYRNLVVLYSNTTVSSNGGGNLEFDSKINAGSGPVTLIVRTTGMHIYKSGPGVNHGTGSSAGIGVTIVNQL